MGPPVSAVAAHAPIRRAAAAFILTLLACAFDLQAGVVYDENFDHYGPDAAPPGWVTSVVGQISTKRRAVDPPGAPMYRTWTEPGSSNVVFGTRQAAGDAGTFSTLTSVSFASTLDYSGRFLRTTADTRVGLVFFSSYPENDRYYVIGTAPSRDGRLTMSVWGSGATQFSGGIDSGYAPEPNAWVRFRVIVDGGAEQTTIRARFWPDGSAEEGDAIVAVDHTPAHLTGGRIGIWSAISGGAFVDDLVATSSASSSPGTSVAVAIRAPSPNQTIGTSRVTVSGTFDDAVSVTVNGTAATLDNAHKTFTAPVTLFEGANTITAVAISDNGSTANASVHVVVDTRPPEVTIASPAPSACLDASSVEIHGQASDPALQSVKVAAAGTSVDAGLTSDGAFAATVAAPGEGTLNIRVTAADSLGHTSAADLVVNIDRTAPRVTISESGAPLDGVVRNRTVTPLTRVVDADGHTEVTVTLDGAPFTLATAVSAEGEHVLEVSAADCAGHRTRQSAHFTIDRTPPALLSIEPKPDSTIGTVAPITGTVSPDTATVAIEPLAVTTNAAGGAFTIDAPLAEGDNEFTIKLIDRAGNIADVPYHFKLKSTVPQVEILESGNAIPPGAVFNRTVAPLIRVSDPTASITTTLNDAPFTPGAAITADGDYTLVARAADSVGHSSTASASFSIDTAAPLVKITAPKDGDYVTGGTIEVHGTVSSDAAVLSVNGNPVAGAGGSFTANVALDAGPNEIVAIARDRAGNVASDRVGLTRTAGPRGILLTAPADQTMTNRATTVVSGQVLTPSPGAKVTIGGVEVPVDAGGAFRRLDVPLAEGANVIVASLQTAAGETNQTSVRVTADRTPPFLRLLESGQPLAEGSRFADHATITAQASDGGVPAPLELFVDGAAASQPATISAPGGHTIVASAHDLAGNESRVERTIVIGSSGGAGCALSGFDPANGSVIPSNSVTIAGRSGGAAGVTINGIAAFVANGSFCGTVELPVEGDNAITVACTDGNGQPAGTSAMLVLKRVTGAPSVTIDSPAEESSLATETVTVTGSIGTGVTSVDVNGVAAVLNGGSFTATNVHLSGGLNVIAVRAMNGAGRSATASRRVVYLKDTPSLLITSPAIPLTTGTPSIDVSGVWSNLDPSTITIGGGSVQSASSSDTFGTFTATVSLTSGAQTIAATAHDAAGRTASASIVVTLTPGAPSIAITGPPDNSVMAANTGVGFTVNGTFSAAPGAIVDVGGVPATIDGSSFTATVPFSTLPGGITPVVARVTEPSGNAAIDTMRVQKLAVGPHVIDRFPASAAVEIDPGALLLVLFSAPMDRTSLASAFRLETSAGAPVNGTVRVDRDVLTFAPAALLESGGTYTMRIGTGAHDIAGNPLDADFASSFTISTSAPLVPPSLTGISAAVCAQQQEIRGTAPANARLRLEYGALTLNTTAAANGSFSFQLPLSGQSGCQVARVRVAGNDGTLSPPAEVRFQVDCTGPQVTAAAFDRTMNRLSITFSKEMNPATLVVGQSGSILLQAGDGHFASGSAAVQANVVTVTPAEDLSKQSFTLSVLTAAEDSTGAKLAFAYTQAFNYESDQPPASNKGLGFIAGEVYDGETGRPLAGADVSIDAGVAPIQSATDARGRYAAQLPEGAHTIRISSSGFVTVWREIIVPAGAGVIPIDVRLAKIGTMRTTGGGDFDIAHGSAQLHIPAGGATSGTGVALTAVPGQSLPGLLPLGWSPLACASIDTSGAPIAGAQLTFTIAAQDVTAAAQTITVVRYRDDRDEWQVIVPVANIATDGKVMIPIAGAGSYALVYPDRAPSLVRPVAPVAGATLQGVNDPCANGACPPLTPKAFTIDPPVVLPDGRAVVTLTIDGLPPAIFPSGTAVQAYVDEELELADGSRVSDPPFATDLLLYRDLAGETAIAQFQLAPSAKASQAVLQVGFDHIRILPYPGRLDRGTLIGPEGGKVPGDGVVSVEIPAGATTEPVHATSSAITDFGPFGSIPGFTIEAGLTLTLQPSGNGKAVELLAPARVTFSGVTSSAEHILVEVLDATAFGRLYRLAAQTLPLDGGRVATKAVDRAVLLLDGVVREGRYLLLAANGPIAFATGTVRLPGAFFVAGARVTTPPLGVTDRSRTGGIFAIPVPAKPAGPFTLLPRTVATGDGAAYTHSESPDPDAIVNIGELRLTLQPPSLAGTIPAAGATDVSLTTIVKATFTLAIDPQSVNSGSILVYDADTGAPVSGRVSAEGGSAVVWTLPAGDRLLPGKRYSVVISGSIRGANGTPLGESCKFSFSTPSQIVTAEVHREKIRITIPDSNAHSRVIGDPGAMPAGWQAVPVRRGHDYVTRPQATAASDGSFVLDLPDPTAISDSIDLQVINNAGGVAAIVPLTPFVSTDGRSFIASPEREVHFTTADGKASVTVPAGAFDEPTTITIGSADQSAFASVPDIASELGFAGAVNIDFPGVAKKRLDLAMAAPPGAAPGVPFYLGRLGTSVRGPRVEIVDTLRLDGTQLTSSPGTGAAASAIAQSTFSDPAEVKNAMIATVRGGTYEAAQFLNPMAWLVIETPVTGGAFDLFSTVDESIYLDGFSLVEKRGLTLFPVRADKPFQLVGYDSSTGLEVLRVDHAGLAALDPLNAIPTAILTAYDSGPYPVAATAVRLEVVDVAADHVVVTSVAGLSIEEEGGRVTLSPGSPPLPDGTRVDVLDVTNAVSQNATAVSSGTNVTFPANTGDRLLISVGAKDVDPDQTLSFSFSSSIDLGGAKNDEEADAYLQSKKWIRVFSGDTAATLTDVTRQTQFAADSDARRVIIRLPLQRGKMYRVTISGNLSGPPIAGAPGLKLGQRKVGDALFPLAPGDLNFEFRTREPGGEIARLTLPSDFAGIRDFALTGNVALIATTTGGLEAFDASDPASLGDMAASMKPRNLLRRANGAAEYWSVNVDRHGRVFTTGLTDTFGVVQTYRLENFVDPPAPAPGATEPPFLTPLAGASVSWRMGINVGVPAGTETILSDRPEAIPRRMQVLLQDSEERMTRDALEKATATPPTPIGTTGFDEFNVSISAKPDLKYWTQRVTIENRTIGAHWSADVPRGKSATIESIVARADDELFVVRNDVTYGVVSLFGYGIGVYDLNAIESNDEAFGVAGYEPLAERVILTAANGRPDPYVIDPTVVSCNPAERAPKGEACNLSDLTFSPEALIFPSVSSSSFNVYAIDQTRGLLDMQVTPPALDPGPPPAPVPPRTTIGIGLSLSEPFIGTSGAGNLYHPRLRSLHDLYVANPGSNGIAPHARFTSASAYLRTDKDGNPQDYALLAANSFGLVVVRIDDAGLDWNSLADVVWIPAGALAVRVIPHSDLAVVIDNAGRVLLVDLRQIDESGKVAALPKCTSDLCAGELFPTAKKSVVSPTPPLPPDADWIEVGVDDPRIVLKTGPHTVRGNVAPVIDPETGVLLTGDINGDVVKAIAAIDPHIRFRIVSDEGPRYVNSIVPLGIEPNAPHKSPDSSYGAFKVELTLPGSLVESIAKSGHAAEVRVALESERVLGAETEQTIAPLPPAHLRQTKRDGGPDERASASTGFRLQRVAPYDATDPKMKLLRYQRAYNRFESPWIVAIADPRASEQYHWGAKVDPATKGCFACKRPASLQGKNAPDVYELFTRGRVIAARPELSTFAGSAYAYLGDGKRLDSRAATWMADTTRPPEVGIAAQNPPIAVGALLETTYLHSGEVETSAVDMDAGGRNGFDVVIGRVYRSRSYGSSVLGPGWDSPMFKRLRELPGGDVEYRDGAGNISLFRAAGGMYAPPPGLFVALARSGSGWTLRDQRSRVMAFDNIGRIVREGDEFFDPLNGSGNAIEYRYDAAGRLSTIIDPVGRTTRLNYYSGGNADGLLQSVAIGWRKWTIDYEYDSRQRLTSVRLPNVTTTDGTTRPSTRYEYQPVSGYDDLLDVGDDLTSITDPHEVLTAGPARVTFGYDTAGDNRDRVTAQSWATGESAQFSYTPSVKVHDVLGQDRVYKIAGTGSAAHVTELVEQAVETAKIEFGKLPAALPPAGIETEPHDRHWIFEYDEQGLRKTAILRDDAAGSDISVTANAYVPASAAPGLVPRTTITTSSADGKSITQTFDFATGTFLKSVSAGALLVNTPEATRENVRKVSAAPLVSSNDSIESRTKFDAFGRIAEATSSGGIVAGGGSAVRYSYKPGAAAAEYERGETDQVDQAGLVTKYSYTADSTTTIDPRGVTSVVEYDEWHRPAHVTRSGPGLTTEERYRHDASGRLVRLEEKQGTDIVTTEYAYDAVGRQTSVRRDHVVVKGTTGTRTTTSAYDLGKRTLTTTLPGGGTVTRHVDGLGRVVSEVSTTGADPIEHRYAYDIAGNRIFATDLRVATASAFDVFGRETGTINADGTRTTREFDDWGRATRVETSTAAGAVVEKSKFAFTAAGRLTSTESPVDDVSTRKTSLAWDGAGRTVAVEAGGRATWQQFDDAGRLVLSQAGEGSIAGMTAPIVQKAVKSYDGALPQTIAAKEKSGPAYDSVRQFDTNANVTGETIGDALETNATFDELGNVTSATPAHAIGSTSVFTTAYERDSTGATTKETLADGAENRYEYEAAGAVSRYTDPSTEATQTEPDLLGRPLKRLYADGTVEVFSYESDRLKTYTDRQGRTQVFNYNERGQLTDIERLGTPKLDHLDYDDAGRLTRWTNKDSALSWGDFNFDGKPRKTTLTVYKDGSGLTTKDVAAEFEQEHAWDQHGERTEWTMPRPAGFGSALPWTDRIRERRDALANVVAIERSFFGSAGFAPLLDADYRNAGRPSRRTVTTPSATIVRQYGYEPATGLLNEMSVSIGPTVVAGTHVDTFDGVKLGDAQLLGISAGTRTVHWSYDKRLRLESMSNGRSTKQSLTPADFRSGLERTPRFDAAARSDLATRNIDVHRLDPPSQSATEQVGHKFKQTVDTEAREFFYNGSELADDSRFAYEWDEKGRLIRATQKTAPAVLLRVTYAYDGNDRMISRRVEMAKPATPADWSLATGDVLTDGIPADSIFVWDPITDRIAAIFDRTSGALSRQIIHGGLGYDDPIEVTTRDSSGLNRMYPVYDEAGAGHLQSVLNARGEIVSRKVIADAYGDETLSIAGAAVDRVQVTASKDAAGAIASLDVTVRSTEQLRESTVAGGLRLAAIDASRTVLRSAEMTPILADPYTAKFSLSGADWTALTAGADAISVSVTNTLRARAWSADLPLLPAPAWAVALKPVFSNPPDVPIEVQESMSNLSFASVAPNSAETKTLYEVDDIALLGSDLPAEDPARFLVASPFHALPFFDSVTRLTQARARWLSHATGSFLSPDPLGYVDSSNVYSYCAGDPVNRRDATGNVVVLMHGIRSRGQWAFEMSRGLRMAWNDNGGDVRQDIVKMVNERAPGKVFDERNAARAAFFGELDAETMRAGARTAELLQRLRALLDRSKYHRNEPINVIAHSHGTAILLAAARVSGAGLRLGTVVLAGSDLKPTVDLSALRHSARRVVSYMSTDDDTTGNIGAAGGGAGFRSAGIEQVLVPSVNHAQSPIKPRPQTVAWMTDEISRRYFAADVMTRGIDQGDHLVNEDWSWIKEYMTIRHEMAGSYEQIPLP